MPFWLRDLERDGSHAGATGPYPMFPIPRVQVPNILRFLVPKTISRYLGPETLHIGYLNLLGMSLPGGAWGILIPPNRPQQSPIGLC